MDQQPQSKKDRDLEQNAEDKGHKYRPVPIPKPMPEPKDYEEIEY